MGLGIPSSEVLRRVMEDSDDEFSFYDDEFVGDLKIAGNNMVWDRPGMRIGVQSDAEPCLLDSALLTVLMTKSDR